MRITSLLTPDTLHMLRAIELCPLPVVAVVQGDAIAGGNELALHCDIIIAGEGANFAQPEIKLGILPAWGGTTRLPRMIGLAYARLGKFDEGFNMMMKVMPEAETRLVMARMLAYRRTKRFIKQTPALWSLFSKARSFAASRRALSAAVNVRKESGCFKLKSRTC